MSLRACRASRTTARRLALRAVRCLRSLLRAAAYRDSAGKGERCGPRSIRKPAGDLRSKHDYSSSKVHTGSARPTMADKGIGPKVAAIERFRLVPVHEEHLAFCDDSTTLPGG